MRIFNRQQWAVFGKARDGSTVVIKVGPVKQIGQCNTKSLKISNLAINLLGEIMFMRNFTFSKSLLSVLPSVS